VPAGIGCWEHAWRTAGRTVRQPASRRIIRESVTVFCAMLAARRSGRFVSLPSPSDSPSVVTRGRDPFRILLVGSGIVTGAGIASHALGVGGHLARFVSAETARGVELDVVPLPSLLVRFAPSHLSRLDLRSYNALILAVGVNDAFIATSRAAWRGGLAHTLRMAKSGLPSGCPVFLLSIADPTQSPLFRRGPARRAWARAQSLNLESRQIIDSEPDVEIITFHIGQVSNANRLYDASSYLRWARQLGPVVVEGLTRADPSADEPTPFPR
jgi:hypothetical protein